MKKLVAISLLCLHLFGLYGHLVLYGYFVYQSDRHFNEQISMNKYAIDDLVSVKVPVNMPTVDDWTDYAYISGQVKFKDNTYNYVKLRVTKDTLYLMCVPNYKRTQLLNQNIIDARKIADIPASKKDHVPYGKAASLSDYNYLHVAYTFFNTVITTKAAVNNTNTDLVNCFLPGPIQPPELLPAFS